MNSTTISIILTILAIIIISIIVSTIIRKKRESFIVAPKTDTLNECATKCKETVNCHGFIFDINDQCILFGAEIDQYKEPTENIICNKIQPINKFKYHQILTRHNKLKNAIYNCKSQSRQIQVFSNNNKLTNITGLINYDLNNTSVDYEIKDIGII